MENNFYLNKYIQLVNLVGNTITLPITLLYNLWFILYSNIKNIIIISLFLNLLNFIFLFIVLVIEITSKVLGYFLSIPLLIIPYKSILYINRLIESIVAYLVSKQIKKH